MRGADRKIRPRVTVTKLCRVMPNTDPEGRIFLSAWNNHDRFFFLHAFRSPAFDLYVGHERGRLLYAGVRHIEGRCRTWRHNDVNCNVLATELRDLIYNQCINNTCCNSFFISPTGRIKCKIRIVSNGENRGNPCLVYKNYLSCSSSSIISKIIGSPAVN